MQILIQRKLNRLLSQRGISLSKFCKKSRISRQSLYNMFKGESIYNKPFTKLIEALNIKPDQITESSSSQENIFKKAPLKIQKVLLKLKEFCEKNRASLYLFGSQASQTARRGSDWDFGIYFQKKDQSKPLRNLKLKLIDQMFPYRMDVVCLNRAPKWFLQSIEDEIITLYGKDFKMVKVQA